MKIYLSDTLSKKKKEFIPIDHKNVRIYACGPTVYNFAHLGNARMAVVTDLLVRVLKQKYKKVTFVKCVSSNRIFNQSITCKCKQLKFSWL